ncbi:MAG: SMC-Scp complex subunit ScpB [Candidatus Pacearchaeota archaeon]
MIKNETFDKTERLEEIENVKKVEAILFVAGRFLTIAELVSLSDLNPILIKEVIEKLKKKYNNENSAIKIIEKKTIEENKEKVIWKMDVSQEYAHLSSWLATGKSEFSKAEQGTLAIIAFKQPIKQSIVTKIRGNKAYEHIKKFLELGLIRKKKMGHTYEISLSDEFYNYFNISKQEIKENELSSKPENSFIERINEEEK